MDMIHNGQAHGSVASMLLANNFNVASLRPWVGKDGRHYIANNQDGKLIATPTTNATATLRRDEWKLIDDAVLQVAQASLGFVTDLRSKGLTFNIPNGMGKTVLEGERVGDITPATISMDPARKSEGDRPEFDTYSLPLPVVHKDFFFNARQIATSRNNGGGIDTLMVQLATRKVMEEVEKLALGVSSSFSYGGGSVYGLTNFPQRLTKTLTAPTASGWTPKTLVTQILDMRAKSVANYYYGPWGLYVSPAWDPYLDEDYSTSKGDNTLRQRIASITGIQSIVTANFLTGNQIALVQLTNDVVREVIGMDVTTLQWETDGGMRLHFKVMAIMVPQLRADINDQTGIVHGSSDGDDLD